ncbi:hypothetical protein ORJ04_04580 [Rheinheimera baltica]|uniref:Uncharacterized protein n=1 Tax=Rheinheimera baltica TaxID=67576 RepID=A0ABT9HVR2_9GAMM|nr:hypothetical protein [Rheinheimera baltica]MDP5135224.1 hypothetical protein [Rheinheimera baltica]
MSIQLNSQSFIYQTEGRQTRLKVRLEGGAARLFQTRIAELLAEATIRMFRIVQTEDKFLQQRLQMEAQQANEQDFDLLAKQVEKQHKKQDE